MPLTDRAKANDDARRAVEQRWPRAGGPVTQETMTLFLVTAHNPSNSVKVLVLITAKSATLAERSVREHMGGNGEHWINAYAVPICTTTDEVFRQL